MIDVYTDGDVDKLDLTIESLIDFRLSKKEIKRCLNGSGSYTIKEKGEPTACCNLTEKYEGMLEVFAMVDKNAGISTLKQLKKILALYSKRWDIIFTWSISTIKNDRFHEFMGFRKEFIHKGRTLWVKLQKQ